MACVRSRVLRLGAPPESARERRSSAPLEVWPIVASPDESSAAGAAIPPAISIVIPAYNHGRFLEDTLRSIQRQSFRHWECIVVDDGSTDGTSAIAQRYAAEDGRVRTVRIENGGESAARNHGYRLTSPESEFVTFMDSDDIWLPHALATFMPAFAPTVVR